MTAVTARLPAGRLAALEAGVSRSYEVRVGERARVGVVVVGVQRGRGLDAVLTARLSLNGDGARRGELNGSRHCCASTA